MPHPLDHPIWTALTTRQQALAEGGEHALALPADVDARRLGQLRQGLDGLLDVVGRLLPGLSIPFDGAAFVSRVICLVGAVLLAAAAVAYRRRAWAQCRWCGRPIDPDGHLWEAIVSAI